MKKCLSLLWMAFMTITTLQAQNCEAYFPLSLNAESQLTQYDENGKPTGRSLYKVKEVHNTATGKDAVLWVENYDKKDQKDSEGEFKVICKDNATHIDMKAFMLNNPSLKSYEDMDMTMTGDFLQFPNKLSEGMSLPDATVEMVFTDKKTNQEAARMNMKFVNRKVVGKVSVTTPTGTYEAWKVTQEVSGVNTIMTMHINMPTMFITDYIVPGTGVVKSETFDKNNKLKGYSLKT